MKKIILFKKEESTPDPASAPLNKVNPPDVKINVGENAQWLGGIGSGAWYEIISHSRDTIEVQRTQGNGNMDYKLTFVASQNGFNPSNPFKFKHGSHGARTIIGQDNTNFIFLLKK